MGQSRESAIGVHRHARRQGAVGQLQLGCRHLLTEHPPWGGGMGLGGCIIASVNKPSSSRHSVSRHYEIVFVLAIGKPKENVVIDPVGPDGDISTGGMPRNHHVPKRSLEDLIIG